MSDWLRKYLVPVYAEAGEGGGEAAVAEAPAAAEGGEAPAVAEGSEATPAAAPPAADHGNAGKTPWYMKRISEESAKAAREADRAAALERRAVEAEALAQRLAAKQPGEGDAPPPRTAANENANHQAEVRAEAERLRFYEDTVAVRNAGISQFGAQFVEALNVLGAVGATSDDFIADVFGVDKANAHILLDKIAKDPEKAISLAQMPSRQRIAELTRMTQTPVAAAADAKPASSALAKVSKAPAPAPAITPGASKVVDWRADDADDATFDAGFKEMMAKRRAIR